MAYQNYLNRVTTKNGSNQKEFVKAQVRDNLDYYLENSQYGFDVEIDGAIQRIGITTSRMSEAYDGVYVLSKPGILKMGTLFKWEEEHYVVLKRETRVINESFYGEAYRCNIELKWVDDEGILNIQKGYGKGRGFTTILVENKYTQPPAQMRDVNLPLSIATHRNLAFKQDMRFIFNGQPYRVTSVDNLSIDNMSIVGVYDDIIHEGDDLVNDIAAYDKYEIVLGFESNPEVITGTPFNVTYNIRRNGLLEPLRDVDIIIDDSNVLVNGLEIIPMVDGVYDIRVQSRQNPTIFTNFLLTATATELLEPNIFIVGRSHILWNTSESYHLNNNEDATFEVTFPTKVRGTTIETANSIDISVRDKYAGVIELKATTATDTYYKYIDIIAY